MTQRRQHQEMSYSEASDERAFRAGLPGFIGALSAVVGAQLCNVQMEETWEGRDFTITLLSCKNSNLYPSGGTLQAGPAPIDNQVTTSPGATAFSPEQGQYGITGLYVILTWGVGNAVQRCFVTYPYGGGSFMVHGALVRVEVPSSFTPPDAPNTATPLIGAFVSVGRRAQSLLPPTLMCVGADPDINGVTNFYAPPRAVGFRLWTNSEADSTTLSLRFAVTALSWANGLIQQSVLTTNATPYSGENSNALDLDDTSALAAQRVTSHAGNWTHLDPRAVAVRVEQIGVNEMGVGSIPVGIEWILDLG